MTETKKQKVIIAGGTGFVGQGIIKQLSPDKFEVHSLSRHSHQSNNNDPTTYHAVDLNKPEQWRNIVADADWVIDAVGILFPSISKNQTYKNSSFEPAKHLIDVLVTETKPKFLFISANTGPFFMKSYLDAKHDVETYMYSAIPDRAYTIYPGVIYDKDRKSSYYPGLILSKLKSIRYFYNLRPVPRKQFTREIEKILIGKNSPLEKRTI